MPATRMLSFRPDAPIWVVYLVNGKMVIIAKRKENVVWKFDSFEVNQMDSDLDNIP